MSIYIYLYWQFIPAVLSSVCCVREKNKRHDKEETENLNSLPALPQPLSLNRPPSPILTRSVEARALHGRSCMATFDCRRAHLGIPRLASCPCPSLHAQGYPHGHRRRHVPTPPA